MPLRIANPRIVTDSRRTAGSAALLMTRNRSLLSCHACTLLTCPTPCGPEAERGAVKRTERSRQNQLLKPTVRTRGLVADDRYLAGLASLFPVLIFPGNSIAIKGLLPTGRQRSAAGFGGRSFVGITGRNVRHCGISSELFPGPRARTRG